MVIPHRTMPDIRNLTDIRQLDLAELRQLSSKAIFRLPDLLQDRFRAEQSRSLRRSDLNNAGALLEEFKAPFCGHVPELHYEFAFLTEWSKTEDEIYGTRWWINEYPAGVYFIYDDDDKLRYIGSCCGGGLGNRIYYKAHEEYRRAIDVVLFDREWSHFALAFEALAISRLRPDKNTEYTRLWIPPVSPFDRIWSPPPSAPEG